MLEPYADVVASVSVEDESDATRARRAFTDARIESSSSRPRWRRPRRSALRYSAPPSWPALIWNAIGVEALAPDADQPTAIEHTTTVGCQMLAGALARIGAEVPVVSTGPHDPAGLERLGRAIAGSAVAGAVRGQSVVRIGRPPVGYLNVECEEPDLTLLGARLVEVEQPELDEAFEAATGDDAAAVLAGLCELGVRTPAGLEPAPSARLAHAIGAVLDRHGAIAASTNCSDRCCAPTSGSASPPVSQAPSRRRADGPSRARATSPPPSRCGSVAALRARRCIRSGISRRPCDGDALLLSCGLADLAFGLADSASLYEVTGVPGVRGTASGVRYAPRTGPATLIGMSAAADGWRLSWLEGEARGEASRHLRGVAVRFRPSGLDALAAASSWISAGVTHHPVLVPGRLGETLALVARALGAREIAA